MEAVEFLKEWKRMCASYSAGKRFGIYCTETCPILKMREKLADSCWYTVLSNPEKAVEAVNEWSKEHPLKTRMQDFFEKYPKVMKCENGIPTSCCKALGYIGIEESCLYDECEDCWNKPVEE